MIKRYQLSVYIHNGDILYCKYLNSLSIGTEQHVGSLFIQSNMISLNDDLYIIVLEQRKETMETFGIASRY